MKSKMSAEWEVLSCSADIFGFRYTARGNGLPRRESERARNDEVEGSHCADLRIVHYRVSFRPGLPRGLVTQLPRAMPAGLPRPFAPRSDAVAGRCCVRHRYCAE